MATNIEPRYSVTPENWYRQFPYTFLWRKSDDDSDDKIFNLPIAPQNIQITTHFATNVIPTMYGTIEEHSEQRYFDITISGTTGMAPKYFNESYQVDEAKNDAVYKMLYPNDDIKRAEEMITGRNEYNSKFISSGRTGYTISTPGFNLGLFRKTTELLLKAKNEAADILGNSVNKQINSGIQDMSTGYAAFHNFYLFLLKYKDHVSRGIKPKKGHPLSFINYKDNNSYDVSITNFSLVRDYRNPMLYNYSISMKAYNLRSADSVEGETISLGQFGLDGIKTSAFATFSNKARKAKNAAYAAIAAVKSAGS